MQKRHSTCVVVHRNTELSKEIWLKCVPEFEQVFLYLRVWGFPKVSGCICILHHQWAPDNHNYFGEKWWKLAIPIQATSWNGIQETIFPSFWTYVKICKIKIVNIDTFLFLNKDLLFNYYNEQIYIFHFSCQTGTWNTEFSKYKGLHVAK